MRTDQEVNKHQPTQSKPQTAAFFLTKSKTSCWKFTGSWPEESDSWGETQATGCHSQDQSAT